MIPFDIFNFFYNLSKLNKFDFISLYIKLILMFLIGYKTANSFGYYFNSDFEFTLPNMALYLTSGQILLVLLFSFIGYFIVEHAIDFFAWIFGRPTLKELDKHIKDLESFDVINKNGSIISKSVNYKVYEFIIEDIEKRKSIQRILRNIITIFVFIVLNLIMYDLLVLWADIILTIIAIYFYFNYVFVVWRLMEIKIYRHTIKSKIEFYDKILIN